MYVYIHIYTDCCQHEWLGLGRSRSEAGDLQGAVLPGPGRDEDLRAAGSERGARWPSTPLGGSRRMVRFL